jgi:hypothetical protein
MSARQKTYVYHWPVHIPSRLTQIESCTLQQGTPNL